MLRVHLLKLFLYIYPHDETIAGWIRTAVLFKCKIDWTNSKFSSDNLFFQWQLAFAGCKVISSPSSAIFFARSLGWLGPPSFLKNLAWKKTWDLRLWGLYVFFVGSRQLAKTGQKEPRFENDLELKQVFLRKTGLEKISSSTCFSNKCGLEEPQCDIFWRKNGLEGPQFENDLELFFFETLILEKSPVRQFFWEKAGLENCCCRTLVRREQP